MTYQERICWVSNESTNSDHRYHTFEDCSYVKKIKYHRNLITITVGEAYRRGLQYCDSCQRRRERS